jgi:hypothetical protein
MWWVQPQEIADKDGKATGRWRMTALPELDRLLLEAKRKWDAMAPDEQEAMMKKQREGYVKAEMSWPRDCPYR